MYSRQQLFLLFILSSLIILLPACMNKDNNSTMVDTNNKQELQGSEETNNGHQGNGKEETISSNISWPEGQQLPSFSEPEQLDVVDVVEEPGEIKLMFATLQGIINREQPRIYLLENREEGKYTWLKDLDVSYEVSKDYWEIIEKYKQEINGMIIYDPEVVDTINVATTLAGIEKAIVVSPDLAKELSGDPYNFGIIEDFQGKFENKIDAYEWQMEHLWEHTTNRMIVGLSPGTSKEISTDLPNHYDVIAEDATQETEANNRDTYVFDLSNYLNDDDIYIRFEDAFPNDGWGPAVHEVTVETDGETILNFVANTEDEEKYLFDRHNSQVSTEQGGHRFADNDSYFVYRFTPPEDAEEFIVSVEMWNQFKVSITNVEPDSSETVEPYGYLRDYAVANQAMVFWLAPHEASEREIFDRILEDVDYGTPYLGWFADDVKGEFGGVEYLSSHGVYVIPADWFNNMTVFSGMKKEPVKPRKISDRPLENKIYVTLMYGEGDNFQYNQHRMRKMWDDFNRGKVPVNWTSSPLLYDGAPSILTYYQDTATENDLLITGPSGVGYFYADSWPQDHFSKFLEETYPYIEKSGMTIPYVLNRKNELNIPLSEEKAKAYEEYYDALGLFLSWEDKVNVEMINDSFPISTIRGVSSIREGMEVLESVLDKWDGESPTFVSLGLLAWNFTPSDVVTMTRSLDSSFEIILADEYLSLIKKAHEHD